MHGCWRSLLIAWTQVPLDDRKQNMRVLVHALQVRPVVHLRALLIQYCHRTQKVTLAAYLDGTGLDEFEELVEKNVLPGTPGRVPCSTALTAHCT